MSAEQLAFVAGKLKMENEWQPWSNEDFRVYTSFSFVTFIINDTSATRQMTLLRRTGATVETVKQAGEGGPRTGDKEWREVGCQSDATERRDAAVQVDLLNPTAPPVVMWQCVDVTANRPAGGALTPAPPASPRWTPLDAPRPAASAACRKKILVLNKGGGRRVLLVMDTAHLQTASPAGAPAVRAEVAKRPSLQVAPCVRAAATTPQTKEAALHMSPAAPRLSRPPAQRSLVSPAVTAGRPTDATRDSLNPAQSSPPSAPSPGRNKILVMSAAGRQVLLVMNASQQPPPHLQPHPTATAAATNQSHLSLQPSADHRPQRDRLAPGAPSLPAAPPPYVCEFCGLRYAAVATLRRHRRHIHGAGGIFICRVCGKGLGSRRQLARHSLLHRGHKLYACPLCTRSFSHLGPLRQHHRRLHRHGCHGGTH